MSLNRPLVEKGCYFAQDLLLLLVKWDSFDCEFAQPTSHLSGQAVFRLSFVAELARVHTA